MSNNRRHFIQLGLGSLAAVPLAAAAGKLIETPDQTAGPFYPAELPLDSDNDLIQIEGHAQQARGTSTNVIGRVLSPDGDPIADARVEIWQCDANGKYHHPDDENDVPMDEHFQAYGATTTDTKGRYRFRTIKPVPYPGRVPHIHYRVTTPGGNQLNTQLYIAGFEGNEEDFVFRHIGDRKRQQSVVAEFKPSPDDSAELLAEWDVVVG